MPLNKNQPPFLKITIVKYTFYLHIISFRGIFKIGGLKFKFYTRGDSNSNGYKKRKGEWVFKFI